MKLKLLTRAEQVANHVRQQISKGRWQNDLPGVATLGNELGVNVSTMNAALQLLEKEGLLVPQGSGKGRMIKRSKSSRPKHYLIRILLFHEDDLKSPYLLKLLSELQRAGLRAEFSNRTLSSMKMNVRSVSRLVSQTTADAWVVLAGSQDVLRWFGTQNFPTFALFGYPADVDIAYSGPTKGEALRQAVRRLFELGHRRIVYLNWSGDGEVKPKTLEAIFVDELRLLGVEVSSYNFVNWKRHREGLNDALDKLFSLTPPSAMFIESEVLFTAVERYLAGKKIAVPEDVSIICLDPHPSSEWCMRQTSCIEFDSESWVKRITGWAKNVSRGKDDRRRKMVPSKFIEGGTIGPENPKTG